ncbi:MAG TPA: hypothetical protein ENO12_02445 [Thermoplasmatales archaeon]|nr:hypothetical protein [Thermoplasmatales archaeon]
MLITAKDQTKRNTGKQLGDQQDTWIYVVPPAGIEPATPGLGILEQFNYFKQMKPLSAILGVIKNTWHT